MKEPYGTGHIFIGLKIFIACTYEICLGSPIIVPMKTFHSIYFIVLFIGIS